VGARGKEQGVGLTMSHFMKAKHLVGSCEPTLIHFRKNTQKKGGGLRGHGRGRKGGEGGKLGGAGTTDIV